MHDASVHARLRRHNTDPPSAVFSPTNCTEPTIYLAGLFLAIKNHASVQPIATMSLRTHAPRAIDNIQISKQRLFPLHCFLQIPMRSTSCEHACCKLMIAGPRHPSLVGARTAGRKESPTTHRRSDFTTPTQHTNILQLQQCLKGMTLSESTTSMRAQPVCSNNLWFMASSATRCSSPAASRPELQHSRRMPEAKQSRRLSQILALQ
jgi:hypothetical protein